MRKIVSIVCVSLVCLGAYGQDRTSFYFNGNIGLASGNFKSYLNQTDDVSGKFGIAVGFLTNPRKKIDYSFPIKLGGEIGFQNLGNDDVRSDIGGFFTNGHSAYWFNFISRYRPRLENDRLFPFIEIQAGPKLLYSKILEQVSSEESFKVDGYSSWSKNYGIGTGIDFKLNPKNQSKSYMELSIFYFYGEKAKQMTRNSALIDGSGFSNYTLSLASSQQWQLRLGIIGLGSSQQ